MSGIHQALMGNLAQGAPMDIEILGTLESNNGANNIIFPAAWGLQEGDLVIVAYASGGSGPNQPGGWEGYSGNYAENSVFWKQVGADGLAGVSLYSTGAAVCVALRNARFQAYVDMGGNQPNGGINIDAVGSLSDGQPNPPGITTEQEKSLVLAFGFWQDEARAGAVSYPSGYAEAQAKAEETGANMGTVAVAGVRNEGVGNSVNPGGFGPTSTQLWAATTLEIGWLDPNYVEPPGQVVFSDTFGVNTSWVVPPGVTSISAVCVGGGGGAGACDGRQYAAGGGSGGALAYVDDIPVTPGEVLQIEAGERGHGGQLLGANDSHGQDGGRSLISRNGLSLVEAGGGLGGGEGLDVNNNYYFGRPGGSVVVGTGGSGGAGGSGQYNSCGGAGGGAGGYSGAGGNGGTGNGNVGVTAGSGGAGGGGGAGSGGTGAGGGVGLLGEGASGAAGSSEMGGGGGSGGERGQHWSEVSEGGEPNGGNYGGGGGATEDDTQGEFGNGAPGAVRIIWGAGRSFPNNAADV